VRASCRACQSYSATRPRNSLRIASIQKREEYFKKWDDEKNSTLDRIKSLEKAVISKEDKKIIQNA
jgi:hypothetical protein